jgi:diacylglycerol kinase
MPIWLTIAALLAAVAVGLPLSIWLTAPLRRNKKAFAIASALFFSFGLFNPSQEKIVEARGETDHAKRQKAADPPEPD